MRNFMLVFYMSGFGHRISNLVKNFQFLLGRVVIVVLLSLLIKWSYSQPVYMTSKTSRGISSPATVNRPTGIVAGDLLVIGFMIEKGQDENITPPSGWNLIRRTNNTSNCGIATYYKIAGASEPVNYSFTIDNDSKWCLGISRISNADISSPVEVFADATGASGNATAPSITTLGDNRLILCFYTNKINATFSPDGSTNERYDFPNNPESLPSNMLADYTLVSAGSTGNKAATPSNSSERWAAQQIAIRPGIPLPVELLDFDARKCSGRPSVCLEWVTGSEMNNDYFSLERSTDYQHFISIARIKGQGNSSVSHFYFYEDSTTFNVRNDGVIYYRLVQYDIDGKSNLLKTKAVRIENLAQRLSVFPNPAHSLFSIRGSLPCDNSARIIIRDITGREVITKSLSCSKVFSEPIDLGMRLEKGLYSISVISEREFYSQALLIE